MSVTISVGGKKRRYVSIVTPSEKTNKTEGKDEAESVDDNPTSAKKPRLSEPDRGSFTSGEEEKEGLRREILRYKFGVHGGGIYRDKYGVWRTKKIIRNKEVPISLADEGTIDEIIMKGRKAWREKAKEVLTSVEQVSTRTSDPEPIRSRFFSTPLSHPNH
jgi:hypothetical protein